LAAALILALAATAVAPLAVEAQARGKGKRAGPPPGLTISAEAASHIRTFYASRAVHGAEALPPGIRKRLARGKPLPPGIAKKVAPQELRSLVGFPAGYELVEAGVDVLLVEVSTGVVHDILMDIIR
jgi:hypothetical protein